MDDDDDDDDDEDDDDDGNASDVAAGGMPRVSEGKGDGHRRFITPVDALWSSLSKPPKPNDWLVDFTFTDSRGTQV